MSKTLSSVFNVVTDGFRSIGKIFHPGRFLDPYSWLFCTITQPVITCIPDWCWSEFHCAVQPWSHFRGLFISVVLHFSTLICMKRPRWPLTLQASVSEGMCLPDVNVPDPQTAETQAFLKGISRWQHTEFTWRKQISVWKWEFFSK